MNPFERFLIHFTRAHPEMSVEEIEEEARGYYERKIISETEKENMEKAIKAVKAVAAKYESTWKDG